MNPLVESFRDNATSSFSHVVYDVPGGHAAIVDPVLGYDEPSARTSTALADRLLEFVTARRLELAWILETHAHADHMCHDYPPAGRAAAAQTSIGAQQSANVHVHEGVSEEEFVQLRKQRDATLPQPRLIVPALRANIRGGGDVDGPGRDDAARRAQADMRRRPGQS